MGMNENPQASYSADQTKRRLNVTVRADLIEEAKALGINISSVLERALETETRLRRREQWQTDNRAAMDAWNDWLDENGMPLEHIRAW